MKLELLNQKSFHQLLDAQTAFDQWRFIYNTQRPHQAIGMKPPSTRYQASQRAYPEKLPTVEYRADDILRKIGPNGCLYYDGYCILVTTALQGQQVALRPTSIEGEWLIFFCHQLVKKVQLKNLEKRKYT